VVQEDVPFADDRKNILIGGKPLGNTGIEGGSLWEPSIGSSYRGRKSRILIGRDFVNEPFFNAKLPGQ